MIWYLEYNGETKSFADWKITNCRAKLLSQGTDEFSFSSVEDFGTSQQFAYDEQIIIHRQPDDLDPGTRVKWFEGWVEPAAESESEESIRRTYRVTNVWRWFDRLPLQKVWYKAVDPEDEDSAIVGGWRSDVVLNMGYNGSFQTIAQQIEEILDYVNQVAVAQGVSVSDIVQLGNGCPTTYLPMNEMSNVTCAEAIRHQLKWVPNAVTRFDYSTTPPTMYVEIPVDVHSVILADRKIGARNLTPRHDRVVDRVRIKMKQQNTTNGVTWEYDVWDVYPVPASGTGTFLAPSVGGGYYCVDGGGDLVLDANPPAGYTNPPGPPPAPDNTFSELLLSLDLIGWKRQYAQTTIETMVWGTNDWLKKKLPFLNPATGAVLRSKRLVRLIYQDGTVYDPLNPGVVPAPALLNDVLHGVLMDGLRFGNGDYVQGQQYTAIYELNHATTIGGASQEKSGDIQTVKFTATDATTGSYSGLQSETAGDPIPTGLAQKLYEALSVLQHDGSVTLREQNAWDEGLIGKLLTITGGNPDHADMLIQAVEFSIDGGATTVSVGVPKHLSAGDMVSLLRVARTRTRWTAPDTVTTGRAGGSANSTPSHTSADNSVGGLGLRGVDSWSGKAPDPNTGDLPATRMEAGVDAKNGVIRLTTVGAGDQDARPDYGQEVVAKDSAVVLDLFDAEGEELRIRDLTVDDGGVTTVLKYVASADATVSATGGPAVWL